MSLGVENSFEWRLRKKRYFSSKLTGITCQFFLLLSPKSVRLKNKNQKKQKHKNMAQIMH
ncbi:hypothetical protein ALTERO38_60007 [Alteromonas sp. 38]|nr:hypothetical protein ALTER154_40783 [Alteromonas sp. 154]VXC04923.1 hypothetical protein ALTERO38_60007 [Alteromonas sp. 38]